MANWRDMDWLLGRTFWCRLRVERIGEVPLGGRETDRMVAVLLRGEAYELSLGELRVMIEKDLLREEES